jgi:hypothetical protein
MTDKQPGDDSTHLTDLEAGRALFNDNDPAEISLPTTVVPIPTDNAPHSITAFDITTFTSTVTTTTTAPTQILDWHIRLLMDMGHGTHTLSNQQR